MKSPTTGFIEWWVILGFKRVLRHHQKSWFVLTNNFYVFMCSAVLNTGNWRLWNSLNDARELTADRSAHDISTN